MKRELTEDEVRDRFLANDPRVFHAIQNARRHDNSFKESENIITTLFGGIKYSKAQCREFWFQAMELGILEGLRIGSIQGQKIDLFNNCKKPKQREFLEKYYKLAEEYNCAIVYHPHDGMIVMDLNRNFENDAL